MNSNTEAELIDKVNFYSYSPVRVSSILNDEPGITPNVLIEAISLCPSDEVFIAVLSNPALNEEVLKEILRKINYVTSTERIYSLINNSPYFNENLLSYLINNAQIDLNLIHFILNSSHINKNHLVSLIMRIKNLYSSPFFFNACLLILDNQHCTSDVIDIIINTQDSDSVMNKCMDSVFFTSQNLFNLLKKCIDSPILYLLSITKAIAHPKMTQDIFDTFIAPRFKQLSASFAREIVKSPFCPESILLQMNVVNYWEDICMAPNVTPKVLIYVLKDSVVWSTSTYTSKYNKKCLAIINSPAFNEDVAIEIIKTLKSSDYSMSDVYLRIIDHPACTGKVLAEMVKNRVSNEVASRIIASPLVDKQVRINLIINNSSFSNEDLDAFFAIDGLTTDDVCYLIEQNFSQPVLTRVIDYPGLDTKLALALVEAIYKSNNTSLLNHLLEKDLHEAVLVSIVNKCYNANVLINDVMTHPNAGLMVASAVITAADRFQDTQKKTLLTMAKQLKDKIIAKMFKVEQEENVTEMLRCNVEDGLSTMLWGPSGVGKSSRVFEIDPTATLLILKNGMLPEEVIGGKEPNGEPGKIYPPHWYTSLCEKCADEPDRKHILFIDEFTNVSDTIKNLVWEVIGNRLVNGHEEWPLPENCSIVVAGNRPEESSAVRIDRTGGIMPEPLHNRIDSMLEIEFDIDEWSKWALETDSRTEKLCIHPLVYSFCFANSERVMFTNFDPENVTQPFLTPRKWETLSKAIFAAEARGGVNTLVSIGRINSIIGNNDISQAFISHYQRERLDMNKIKNGEYNVHDFPGLEDKMYALSIAIAEYDGDEITIEDFISECLGDEYLSVYHTMKNNRNAVLSANSTARGR